MELDVFGQFREAQDGAAATDLDVVAMSADA